MGANVVYTLASVPLALRFLSKEEFGLWALAAQVAGYLLLIDLGITGAVARILVDHKDRPQEGGYGSVVKTSLLVFMVQGVLIAIGGSVLALCLPALMNIPPNLVSAFRTLVAVQCVMTGLAFPGRVLTSLLQAHQRFDGINYSQIVQMAGGLAAQWIAFERGMGVYSLLVASGVVSFLGLVCNFFWVRKLALMPARGAGRANWKVFKEVFAFGSEVFALSVGWQLVSATQVVIVSRTLGLTAAAVWSVGTKVYPLAFQLVSKIFDFSSSAFSEMVVRGEKELLQRRFRDVFLLTTSTALFIGAGVAVCNGVFLQVWTRGEIAWEIQDDLLLGLLLVVTCVTRCHVGMAGPLKKIGNLRYVYLLEGITFVVMAIWAAPKWGISGVIGAGIISDILWPGIYGFGRTARHFGVSMIEILFGWLATAWLYLLLIGLVGAGVWLSTRGLPPVHRLVVRLIMMGLPGAVLFWRAGLTGELRQDLRGRIAAITPEWAQKAGASLGI
jgi:O-antigen/teichoic acid export membrane protein